jgi:hypothetical protein
MHKRSPGVGIAALLCALVCVGCRNGLALSLLDPLAVRSSSQEAMAWDQSLAERLHRPYGDVQRLRLQYHETVGEAERRMVRDQIVLRVLAWIDEEREHSRIRLASGRAVNDAAADIAVLGLASAATLAGGAEIKSALAATATAVTGANLALSEHFLREQTTAAILAHMDANSSATKAKILQRLRQLDCVAYPLAAAEVDLIECLYAGSVVRAITSLGNSAALRRDAGEEQQQ